MADVVDSSDPQEMVDTVLQKLDPGVTPSGSISTPAELADDPGPVSQTPVAGKIQPKREGWIGQGFKSAAVDPIEELETDSEVDRSDTNAKHVLWGGDMTTSRKEPGGAFVNIISTYKMTFGGKPTPRVPLCRLVPYLRVRNFQNTSVMIEALKRSFGTHCYMENGAGFHICPFNETGNYVDVTAADKEKWDDLWRMESEAFDTECRSVPEYAPLVGRKFYTWDGNHRVITWMEVSMSPEKTTKRPSHPHVQCVILIPPVRVYKQIEVAMHNLNA
ncbi:hypothetical protein R1sor_007143 [Riccia sorocarpa]|uniref:Uncharacterized protein n=1 Tax=Riccia sorocarpa TaxID=122646 RepID=A0ABD3HT39_9MARC